MRHGAKLLDASIMENHKLKIVIVDRQELVRKHVDSFLQDSGHRSQTFERVSEFLVSDLPPDQVEVILIDPGPTQEIAEAAIIEIHNKFPEADLLIMDHVTLASRFALANNVFAYLKKPVRLAELELLLARIAQKRSSAEAATGR